MKKIEFVADKNDKLLNLVSKQNVSYAYANKLLRQKDIRINNKKTTTNDDVSIGDVVAFFVPEIQEREISVDIVFENERLIVVNKQKGIEVETTGICLLSDLQTIKNNKNIFALNRLDRNTEGLTLFAKGKSNFDKIKKAMKNEEITKLYLAEIVGTPKWNNLSATNYLLKDDEKSEVKIFDSPKKDSVKITTDFQIISRSSGGTSVVQAAIKNGKTHQIRAQLAHLGYPIVGDGKYGKNEDNKKFKTKTQKLTCFKLIFNFSSPDLSPLNNETLEIHPTWLKV